MQLIIDIKFTIARSRKQINKQSKKRNMQKKQHQNQQLQFQIHVFKI